MNARTLVQLGTILGLLIITPLASAADRSKLTQQTDAQQKLPQTQSVESLAVVKERVIFDPITGEYHVVPVSDEPESSGPAETDSSSPAGDEGSGEEPEPEMPYHHFDPEDPEKTMLTAYLMSELSMSVYSPATTESAFEDDLINKLSPKGIPEDAIDVEINQDYGTELAAFTIGNAVVIAFRGTSSEGTENVNPYVDAVSDLNDDPWPVKIDNQEFFVHVGFWDSVNSVHSWVHARALDAILDGKTVWLTGHSLGGARATLAAMRLHYSDEIPVSGLMTFGSPKTGDEGLVKLFESDGAAGYALEDVTTRFVVHGDPATTFPEKEQIGINFFTGWVYYHHVGHPITIFASNNGSEFTLVPGETFFIPTAAQWFGFLSGATHSEHMWYDDALLHEVREDDNYNPIQSLLDEHESVEQ